MQLASAQADAGHEVSVIAMQDVQNRGAVSWWLAPLRFKAAMLPTRWYYDPRALWDLSAELKRFQPAIIHSWGPRAAIALDYVTRYRIPHVMTFRGSEGVPFGLTRRMTLGTIAEAAAVVVDDTGCPMANLAESRLKRKPFLIEPAAPGSRVPARPRKELFDQLDIPEHWRLIVAVGPVAREKRFHDIVWASDIVKCIRDDFVVVVVGQGPWWWRVQRYRDGVKIDDRVRLSGDVDNVQDLLAHAEMFVTASPQRGVSLAVLEAMAGGLPVIAADGPGNRRLVVPGVTGQLIRPGYRPGFAGWMDKWLADPAAARALGAAGRRRAEQEFPLARMVAAYEEVYRQATNRQASGRR